MASFGEIFWRLSRGPDEADKPPAEVDGLLAALVQRGRSAWPDLAVDPEKFVRHLAGSLDADELLARGVDGLHAGDLALAYACAEGMPAAHAVLERDYLSRVRTWLARHRPTAAFASEVAQEAREKLLVASGNRRPRIAEYSGRSPLSSWLRVVVSRIAIDLKRSGDRAAAGSAQDQLANAVGQSDPEAEYLWRHYQPHFLVAIEESLRLLPLPQRNALRLHYVDRLTLDQTALALGVHRATVARHLAQARAAIVDHTRRHLTERLGTTTSELESLVNLMRSQLDVSLARLMG